MKRWPVRLILARKDSRLLRNRIHPLLFLGAMATTTRVLPEAMLSKALSVANSARRRIL